MAPRINVVLPNGKVVSVDEETALRLEGSNRVRRETVGEGIDRATRDANAEAASGFGQGLATVAEGVADGLTFGLYGKVAANVSEDYAEGMRNRATHNPGLRAVGELGSVVVPFGLPAAAARTGKAVTAAVGAGEATVAAKALGRATEGAITGAGAHVASTNVTGDPLTIEGTLASAGLGGVLNVGFGVASDKLNNIGRKAQNAADDLAATKRQAAVAKEGQELFTKQLNAWDEFRDAAQSRVKAERQLHTQGKKAAEAYERFVSGKQLRTEINRTENAVNGISSRWRDDAAEVVAGDTRAVVSDEMKATLKDYRDRIRRIDQLRAGGFDVDATAKTGKWVKNADIPPDPVRATEELRALREEMQRFPSATRKANWGEIPPAASKVPEPTALHVPRSLEELANMRPDSIERLSNAVAGDAAATSAFNRLAREIGVEATDGIAGVHSKLSRYVRAAEAVSKADADDRAAGFLGLLRSGARHGAGTVALSIGDWLGGGLAGRFVGSQAADALSAVLLQGKSGIQQAVIGAIAKTAPRAAKGAARLGPITAYLSARLPTGEPDSDDDVTEMAKRRAGDVFSLRTMVADAGYLALQPIMGHESDAAAKMHSKIVGDVQYLADIAPKDHGLAMHGLKSDWQPSHDEALTFAYQIEAVTNPLKAIERTIAGDGHPAAVEALWVRWPALMKSAAEEMAFALHDAADMSYEQASSLSMLFRTPITSLADPVIALELQGMYLPKPEASAPPPSANPPGRPPAVQSEVAGSSVAKLIGL